MYTPKAFQVHDQATIEAFLKANSFATIISCRDHKIFASHIPIIQLNDGAFYGHLSINNPQTKLNSNEELLVIFTGEHSYISPTMYESNFNVPTWNYSAVHCYGTLEFIEDKATLWSLFKEFVAFYEGENGWKLPDDDKYKDLTQYIRVFKFNIKNIETTFKCSQNKSNEDIQSVITALKAQGKDEMARFMQKTTAP